MQQALDSDRVIAFRPEIAKYLGSIEAAIIYQQLCHWQRYSRRGDGYFFKSAQELEDETSIGKRSIHRIREKLIELGLIAVKKEMAKGSPTYHYKVLVVPTTLLTSSSDTVAHASDKNDTSITKKTHDIKTTSDLLNSEDEVVKLYKGWLIEMVIGVSKWLAADADSRLSLLESATKLVRFTPKRQQKAEARLEALGYEACSAAIRHIGNSPFHKGDNDRQWRATMEWLFNSDERTEEWANRKEVKR